MSPLWYIAGGGRDRMWRGAGTGSPLFVGCCDLCAESDALSYICTFIPESTSTKVRSSHSNTE